MRVPGKRIWRGRSDPVVLFSRRVGQLSFSKHYSKRVKVMAPVSHPDKDVDTPDGGEDCLIMGLGGGFEVFPSM